MFCLVINFSLHLFQNNTLLSKRVFNAFSPKMQIAENAKNDRFSHGFSMKKESPSPSKEPKNSKEISQKPLTNRIECYIIIGDIFSAPAVPSCGHPPKKGCSIMAEFDPNCQTPPPEPSPPPKKYVKRTVFFITATIIALVLFTAAVMDPLVRVLRYIFSCCPPSS